jgi:hypothetical protein
MLRRSLAILLLLTSAWFATGCRHCQSGYDYCGPSYSNGQTLGFLQRRGSILGSDPNRQPSPPPLPKTQPGIEVVPAPNAEQTEVTSPADSDRQASDAPSTTEVELQASQPASAGRSTR